MTEQFYFIPTLTKTARLAALSLFIATTLASTATVALEQIQQPIPQAPAPIREAMIVAPEPVADEHTKRVFFTPAKAVETFNDDVEVSSVKEAYPVMSAMPDENVWQRIRSGFAMNEMNNPLIQRHEKWYASHPEYVLRMSERARRYLYYIVEEVERRGIPTEIALLPVIESAFNPGANSVASASGIWQFIPSTGKHFGMEQNWWYDERRDVIGATNGALDYLEKLHDQFGDWELALAAYNWGEGAVARAQAKNRRLGKPTDYSHIKMPRETQNYVPKLLAVKNIISDPARFGLVLSDIPNEPYFAIVTPSKPMDIKVAAELAEISMEEFIALNPANNRPVILQDQAEVILLPVDKVDTFRANLEKSDQRLVSWKSYKTEKGESFQEIASRFDIPLDQLRSANGLSKYALQSNGQTLLVPADEDDEFSPFNMHATAVQEMSGFSYTVRKGDTISTIARRFKTSKTNLVAMNRGSHRLRVGQRFTILPGASYPRRANVKSSKKNRAPVSKKVKRAAAKQVSRLAYNSR
ncbi:MAG: membrane-bound lytic murein transglycosylase D [Gallionellaceae bacterium]|nr:MAG: membrane-bound lytic murein transglycosylase D [Gallionellaceae bacterium]